METLEIHEHTKPNYSATLTNGDRIALWLENSQVALEDIIGDIVSYQTLDIARGYYPITTNDEHAPEIAEIVEQDKRGNITDLEAAISTHLERAGMAVKFVSLRGYSQGEWADIVIYAPQDYSIDLDGCADDIKAWFRGDIFTLTIDKLKTYTAQDGETVAKWITEQETSLVAITDSYGWKNGEIDWQTLARDNNMGEIEVSQND